MKAGVRMLSLFFLIAGILIFSIAGEFKNESQPNKVTFGIVVDGEYTQTDQGYIGGNQQASEDMGYLKGIGVIIILLGVGGFIGSFAVKPKDE